MDTISRAIEDIPHELPAIKYRLDEPMKEHTSFRVGGRVRAMFLPGNAGELAALYNLLYKYEVTPLIIGNGTNMLINDCQLDLVVIKTSGMSAIAQNGEYEITADAGAPLSKLADFAQSHGLTGLEFSYGIPGSLGGAVSMNAGAYGGEMKDVVFSTEAFNPGTGLFTVAEGEHGFSYRRSRFTNTEDIVTSSSIRLQKGDKQSVRAKMDKINTRRRESQPLELPSAGSAFKRPKEGFAAALIEQAGLKGFSVGGAQVSEKHSGFIVNRGGATFADIIALINHVQATVFRQFGIELEPEIKIIS